MENKLFNVKDFGHWESSQENLDRLQQLYQKFEDRIEGVE
jgi:magnesium chelatase subunit H